MNDDPAPALPKNANPILKRLPRGYSNGAFRVVPGGILLAQEAGGFGGKNA
jgi:hypothetical protein